MIEPFLSEAAFLEAVRSGREDAGFRLWWLGQSGFLLQWAGRPLLLDPYPSDSLTSKYAGTDKPHLRMTRRLVAPEKLDFVDAVTSSHNHIDHLDGATLGPLRAHNPGLSLVIPEANRAFVADRLRCDPAWPIGLDAGMEVLVAGFRIAALPAAHEMFEFNTASPEPFVAETARLGQPARVLRCGESLSNDDLPARA